MTNKSKKYLLTINNPADHGYDRETIISICDQLQPLYYCFSDEVGLEENTPHSHVFIIFKNARSFNTIKDSFPPAHIDRCYGTNQENRDYVFKEGKWLQDSKGETNIRDSHYESGDMPLNEQGKRNDLTVIHDLINQGYSIDEIIEECPQYSFRINEIKSLINIFKEKQFKSQFRKLDVVYIFGNTGTGKTRYVMEKYGYENVCRVTDYKHPFDAYNYEDVIMFEEFRDDLPIKDMLKYLDGYPLTLPCRFANKQACYTKVYIVSNIPVGQQYIETYRNERETFLAFMRRIKTFMEFDEYGNKFVFCNHKDLQERNFITLDEYERKEVDNARKSEVV